MHELWLLLALNTLVAQPNLPEHCAAQLCWDVSPKICVTEQQNQHCQAKLKLHWRSNTTQNTCLFIAEEKLYCWQDANQGHWQQQLSWQNTDLTLRSSDNTILLQTELQVQSRKPARRRLNSAWSIF
ncbi:DUF3019 domain-containing protein [Rheinheimera sp. D18]|uniref:DUF3019 domain-containing protein n=1 Tax=Rheinheimera sp. D18 TaxID=2545632 RepID=UPI0010455541|nr:DUF3019 domain-containing protein [Rheinheimera sp. D18]QBL08253.1 DUF3019 domain-containing protein [Rheinheimera sp. D18]